ncbi:MAG: NlpC/P60 family protein [Elusimicrobiales bacterium]|nr:NlpC/P60 family protein [Elusimicrobiales bacterium]
MTTNAKHAFAAAAAPRSWTVAHFLPGDFRDFKAKNLSPASFPAGAFTVENASAPAVLTSAELPALFPFDQLLLSADAVFPGGGALQAEAQVKTAAGWSPWFSYGSFDPAGGGASAAAQEGPFGRMDTDILKLAQKAGAFRYRLTLAPSAKPATLRLAAASYTDSQAPYVPAEAALKPAGFKAVKFALPKYSQMTQQVNYKGDICSPVSLAMTLTGLGLETPPLGAAAPVLDSAQNIYGNWFFNTAYAGSRGLYAILARLNTLEEARAFVQAGTPVIASVTFGPDELDNAPLKKTKGHLLVIAGFTAKGDVITHDPAAPEEKTVERVYKREQFARAWLGNKFGTSYLVAKDLNKFLAVKEKVTELYSMPPKAADERRKLIESQLVFNERAELLETSGSWARVNALEQHSLLADNKTFGPYEGWLELEHLGFAPPLAPTAVVRAKTAKSGDGEFSMGVKLLAAGGGANPVALPAGRLPAKTLNPLAGLPPAAELRGRILDTARAFLGDKYYWGGRSAWGVDCSGLVSLSFRAWGLDLPRNADDQFRASRSVSRENLKPGDLIFSADAAKPAAINHVMLYSGNGRLIEATGDSNSVREVTFAEKFGADFKGAKNGMVAGAKKVFFRRILN